MKLSEMFPAKYANGSDLQGKAFTFVIRTVRAEQMTPAPGAQPQQKFVMYLESAQKGVILSRTLAQQIAAVLGDDTDTWTGKKITLYPQSMTVAGQPRIAIRAKAPINGVSEPPKTMTEEEDE
jgi:hypothetical protein